MYKIVIIDDEKLIREGLVDYIDWASLNSKVVATCADGEEGLKRIIDLSPDIVLTDIRMPKLDGISLIEKVRENLISCQIIFISAYSDFHYAQKAIQFGAFDYLLKPIEEKLLYECVERCIHKIESSKRSRPNNDVGDMVHIHISEMLSGVLNYPPKTPNLFLTFLKSRYGVDYKETKQYILSCVNMDSSNVLDFISHYRGVMCCFKITISPSIQAYYICSDKPLGEDFTTTLNAEVSAEKAYYAIESCKYNIYEAYINTLKNILFLSEYFVESELSTSEELNQTNDYIKLLATTLDSKMLMQTLSIFLVNAYDQTIIYRYYEFSSELIALFEHIYDYVKHNYSILFEEDKDKREYIKELRNNMNIYDLYTHTSTILSDIFYKLKNKITNNPYSNAAIQYIHNHYGDNISLSHVAASINISKSHLSKVFKQDLGCNFSDYLIDYRMNTSLVLIREGKYKIYEISQMVGYGDAVHFSKMFKKHFGYTPSRWQTKNMFVNEDSLPNK